MDALKYKLLKDYKDKLLTKASTNHYDLNSLHDEVIQQVVSLAQEAIQKQYGPPPTSYSFFVMGSAGRMEQSVWSDQDHGIVYQDETPEASNYFLALGKEISDGLHKTGYPYCDGGVMSCNPMWCKSKANWKQQVTDWLQEASWESIRHLLIFLDSRSMIGKEWLIKELKEDIYHIADDTQLLTKVVNNTMHLKKGINLLGQFLVETHGPHAGTLNIKEIGLFPYINAVRLLAIKEHLQETSTLSRLEQVPYTCASEIDNEFYKEQFLKLLNYRLMYGDQTDYDSGHFLSVKLLSKDQSKELKDIIKNGHTLFHTVRKLVEKEGLYGNE